MLIDRRTWSEHAPWFIFCLLVLAGSGAWYGLAALSSPDWPGGGSWPGFTLGVVGGLIILFEFLLWPRKHLRTWRLLRVKTWMKAHIWLGLLCLPLLIIHSGFRLGGPLAAALTLLLVVVIASGVWGLILQQYLPKLLLDEVPAETITSQIDRVGELMTRDAARLVVSACGPSEDVDDKGEKRDRATRIVEASEAQGGGVVVVGAVRSAGRVQGKTVATLTTAQPDPAAEPLRSFFSDTLEPYLSIGKSSGSPLWNANRSGVVFADLRTKLPVGCRTIVDALEGLSDQRRQLDLQRRICFWLHNWLCLHLPLSAALVVLMIVHAVAALKYW